MKKAKASFLAPLFALILYLLTFSSSYLKDRLIAQGGNIYLSVIILQVLIFFIPAILFCRMKGVGYAAKLGIRLFSPGKLGTAVVGGLVLILGSILLRFLQITLTDLSTFRFSLFEAYISGETTADFLFTATAFAIVPALTEELVFRSILLTEYNEGGYRAVTATVITSLLCGMMYLDLELLPIRFFSSVILCLVAYGTGSSLASLLSHLIFNIYGVFGEQYMMKALTDPSNRILSIFTFTMLFLIVLIIFFSELEHTLRQTGYQGTPSPSYRLKKTKDGTTPDLAATEEEEENGSRTALSQRTKEFLDAYFSPTLLLCILFFLVSVFGFI